MILLILFLILSQPWTKPTTAHSPVPCVLLFPREVLEKIEKELGLTGSEEEQAHERAGESEGGVRNAVAAA